MLSNGHIRLAVPEDGERLRGQADAGPRASLTLLDGIVVVVGIGLGIGLVSEMSRPEAYQAAGDGGFILWVAGLAASFVGALCFAELSSAYPHCGGDYHYLARALGRVPSFLFAWCRIGLVQTALIAGLAFVLGESLLSLPSLGACSAPIYGASAIATLSMVNILGTRQARHLQRFLACAAILGLGIVVLLSLRSPAASALTSKAPGPRLPVMPVAGLAFALLSFGGWREAVYLSEETHRARKTMSRVLLYGIGVLALVYGAVSFASVKVFDSFRVSGLYSTASSIAGLWGANGLGLMRLVCPVALLAALNGLIMTGARVNYAAGRDFALFRYMGVWAEKRNTPARALSIQALASIALVTAGSALTSVLLPVVAFTAPVTWLFLFLAGVSSWCCEERRNRSPGPSSCQDIPSPRSSTAVSASICSMRAFRRRDWAVSCSPWAFLRPGRRSS